uniref:Elongator complex protein 5 n=1 Tax=Haemonchus contortus TaxID=6289 RepID=A0A7I4Y8N0_HAECO
MALRALVPNGFLLLRDNESCHCEPLAFALARSSKSFVIVTITGRENVLRRRYGGRCEGATFTRLDYQTTMERIHGKIVTYSPSCCILDCMDVFVDKFSVDVIAAFISRLKAKFPVIAVCPEASINEEEYNRLHAVANSVIRLQRRGNRSVSELVMYKKNGKRIKATEAFSINADLEIFTEKFEPSDVISAAASEKPSIAMDMEPELSEKELAARSQLNLPFTSQFKQSHLNKLRLADRKVRVGGQIIYTPDKEDDLDDSDPDEDLNL